MSYATNTDVAPDFPALAQNGGFTSSTVVTAAQVDEWCARASNLIDAKIGGKYSTPVDSVASPKSFSLLKDICCMLVRPRVAAVLSRSTEDTKSSSGPASSADWTKRAYDMLKEIQSGATLLVDAPLATTTDGAESYTNDNAATLQPPEFTREGDNW